MGSPYDFKIDTLEFRCAIKDDTPYARSTAPFRKDQIDTSGEAGDQSLTGWWTRGQFSFHEGAGIKYYEVQGSDNTLYRFQDSEGIYPWKPGEVTCGKNGDASGDYKNGLLMPPNVRTEWQGSVSSGKAEGLYVITWDRNGGDPRALWSCTYTRAPIQVDTVGANVHAVCEDENHNLYIAVDNTIEMAPSDDYSVAGRTVLWTNNYSTTADENNLICVFWAKGRIWTVDGVGNWFALSTGGGTIAAGDDTDIFWKSGESKYILVGNSDPVFSDWIKWRFAETPGPVYIAHNNLVYAITLDANGAVPTVSTPTVVLDIGKGDYINSIAACSGMLAVCTSTTFRLAAIQSDGSLVLGPPVIEFPGSTDYASTMGVVGDRIFLVGKPHSSNVSTLPSLYEVDTSYMVETLTPAYCIREQTPQAGTQFVTTYAIYKNVFVVGSYSTAQTGLWFDERFSSLRDGGYVTTGYHRFGTLDDKRFYSVIVEVGGDDGSVDVYQVDTSGTETLLLDRNGQSGVSFSERKKEFLFVTADGVEAMALKFVFKLNPANIDVGPTLYGYQIKALPVPQRQRLLKWPLQLTDTWRDRYGQGHGRQGRAWEDLQALEALESAKAIVPFIDNRTGETGSAYIDSVEFQSDTPSTPTSNGFGGIAYVQLRVIS